MKRLLAVVCIVLVALCVYFAHTAQVQKNEALALKEQLAQRRASSLASSTAEGSASPHAIAGARTQAQPAAAGAAAPGRAPSAAVAGRLNLAATLRHNPAWLALRQERYASEFSRRYPDIDKLGLPADKLAELKRLAIERMQVGDDANDLANDQGLDPAEQRQAVQQAFATIDNDVLALVGPDITSKLATMDSQSAIRQQVQQLVGDQLADMNLPLTAAQMQAIAAAVVPSPGPGNSLGEQLGRIAPGVLTPDQLAIVQQALDLQARSQKIIQDAVAAAQNNRPGAETPKVAVSR